MLFFVVHGCCWNWKPLLMALLLSVKMLKAGAAIVVAVGCFLWFLLIRLAIGGVAVGNS